MSTGDVVPVLPSLECMESALTALVTIDEILRRWLAEDAAALKGPLVLQALGSLMPFVATEAGRR